MPKRKLQTMKALHDENVFLSNRVAYLETRVASLANKVGFLETKLAEYIDTVPNSPCSQSATVLMNPINESDCSHCYMNYRLFLNCPN
jgi:hypothetical protein